MESQRNLQVSTVAALSLAVGKFVKIKAAAGNGII